ncbi:hypothetical protein C8R43DRAFT_505996 [Mycena crocata]|nr:hypothetical protein C8R43DRAFT_505996 [Mycena crocata]
MVHQSLKVGNILRLNRDLRVLASGAVNGSIPDLAKLYRILPELESQAFLVLPVFYAHLDPMSIPPTGTLDTTEANSIVPPSIDSALISLNALNILVQRGYVPKDAYLDLWPRSWLWIEWIHTFWSYIPGLRTSSEITICVNNALLVWELGSHPQTTCLVRSTPGVRNLIARAWVELVHDDAFSTQPSTVLELSRLLRFLSTDIESPANLEEVIDGVGGSHLYLASTLMKHISRAVPALSFVASPVADPPAASLGTAVEFMIGTSHRPLHYALLDQGIVTLLVSVLRAFTVHGPLTNPPRRRIAHLGFYLLTRYMQAGSIRVAEALKAGLLPCTVSLAEDAVGETDVTRGSIQWSLKTVTCRILPGNLVSYAVVRQMKISLPIAQLSLESSTFMQTGISRDWEVLVALAEERIRILDVWESGGRPSLHACDNMKCGEINRKHTFRCCSACLSVNYCSRECQRIDWKDAHREDCSNLRVARFR